MSAAPASSSARASLAAIGAVLVVTAGAVLWLGRADEEAAIPAVPAGLSAGCADLHAGHNTMSWDPTMADEMTDLGCGWPYDPFVVPLEGGAEDPALDGAPFDARRYDELWRLLGRAGSGICTVATLTEPDEVGMVFGFRYGVAEPGCPGATADLDLVAREYATRALRDAASHGAEDAGTTFVLGRWVITLTPVTSTLADRLRSGLIELGAVVA